MPDKCNNPYNLNLNYERKTYEMIGKDYIKTKSSRLNNLLFDVLKGFIGENSREYKVCNTYLDWKVYVFSEFTVMAGKFPEGQKRNEFLINFEHWLIRISRSEKNQFECV